MLDLLSVLVFYVSELLPGMQMHPFAHQQYSTISVPESRVIH